MQYGRFSRRDMLKATTAFAAGAIFAEPLRAAAPVPSAITPAAFESNPVTPALIEAARKEGSVVWYCGALDLPEAEKFGKAFEAKYPGISVRVERSGSERIYQRIGQERQSRIHAVDVVNTADVAHFLEWKKNGWLASYVPEDVAKHFPISHVDPAGTYAILNSNVTAIGYNPKLLKREDAPKSFADLLDPRWKGKIVKAHPSFSGNILTTTFILARELGWSYFERLAQQRVLQVQSSSDGPKKVAIGERAVCADGADYQLVALKEHGQSVEVVYPTEGSPLLPVPSGVFQEAPNPNAARLLQSYLFSVEAQQVSVDTFAHHSVHALVEEKSGRTPLSAIKLLTCDAAELAARSEEIKVRYSKIFGV
jgi:iron(III) transport system substrate-binding protein